MFRLVFQSTESANGLLPHICLTTQLRFRRRTLTPPPWVMKKEVPVAKALTAEQRRAFEESGEFDHLFPSNDLSSVQIKSEKMSLEPREWTDTSKRVGLVCRKIGMHPMWLNNGTRVLCTLLEIPENHVISAIDPDTWWKRSHVGKRKAFNRFGQMWRIMIGVDNISPTFLTAAYRRMFEQVNVPYKDRIYGFMATEDAVVPPGTVLDARHFQVGQFVSVTGKTIDWGFQGVMHRWGMRGGPRLNTTKSHRRVGSVGSTGDARVWPGKRMPGHMGYEWRTAPGVEILRINPIKQIIYVKGCVPGDLEETLLIKDCYYGDKVAKNPPFPTYILGEDDVRPDRDENTLLADIAKHDIYSEKVFRFSSPSIIFTEKDETATAVRDASRAKIAKIKK